MFTTFALNETPDHPIPHTYSIGLRGPTNPIDAATFLELDVATTNGDYSLQLQLILQRNK